MGISIEKKYPAHRDAHTRTHGADHRGARVVYMEILSPRTNTVRNKNGSLLDCYLYMRTLQCYVCVRAQWKAAERVLLLWRWLLVISV
jgi:hypothetical protein